MYMPLLSYRNEQIRKGTNSIEEHGKNCTYWNSLYKERRGLMSYPIIRLERIELKDFKNVKFGAIETLEYKNKLFYTKKANIIGIYGQNGSGKTAVVEAMTLLKYLVGGEELPKESHNLINQEADEAQLKFIFYIDDSGDEEDKRYLLYYNVTLGQKLEKEHPRQQIYLKSEVISYSRIGIRGKTELIHYDYEPNDTVFSPKIRYQEMTKNNPDSAIAFEVARRLSYKESRSFIFQTDVIQAIIKSEVNEEYARVIQLMCYYAKMNLFIVANRNISESGLSYMPISFRLTMDDLVSSGIAPISLTGPSVIKSSSYDLVRLVIQQLNIVVGSILPGMHIELEELGDELTQTEDTAKRVELVSVRDGIKVPLKYESEGIKKILSILSTLISVYNNPSICLVVDELDSGIYEYLLGELLEILEHHAKGQLIFTSHNLRALEKLHRDSIVVSTTNPQQRFVRIPHEKGYKNFRNSYLRRVDLGGIDEEVYRSTNSYEISYAFRKAGDLFERD